MFTPILGGHAARTGQVYSHFPAPCGSPESFTVITDGSHSTRSIELLKKIDPIVSIRPAGEQLPRDLPEKFRHYVTTYPMGKQLGLIMSLPRNGPALYVDSDVLFFPGAASLIRDFTDKEAPAFYLPDCQDCSVDSRILLGPSEALLTGQFRRLACYFAHSTGHLGSVAFSSWKESRTFSPTRRLCTSLCMPMALCRSMRQGMSCSWMISSSIRIAMRVRYLVLRHYVNPVRHKFWTHLPALMKSPARPLRILAIVNLPWDYPTGSFTGLDRAGRTVDPGRTCRGEVLSYRRLSWDSFPAPGGSASGSFCAKSRSLRSRTWRSLRRG